MFNGASPYPSSHPTDTNTFTPRSNAADTNEQGEETEYLPSLLLAPTFGSNKTPTSYPTTPDASRRGKESIRSYPPESSPWSNLASSRMDQNYLRKRHAAPKEDAMQVDEEVDLPPTASYLDNSTLPQGGFSSVETTPVAEIPLTRLDACPIPTTEESEFVTGGEYWVTVFGYPPEAASTVLKKFQEFGQVIDFNTGRGNWLNIQYQTKLQASLALSKNGDRILENAIVGVMVARDDFLHDTRSSLLSTPRSTRPELQNTAEHLDILNPPRPANDICSRLFALFGL